MSPRFTLRRVTMSSLIISNSWLTSPEGRQTARRWQLEQRTVGVPAGAASSFRTTDGTRRRGVTEYAAAKASMVFPLALLLLSRGPSCRLPGDDVPDSSKLGALVEEE